MSLDSSLSRFPVRPEDGLCTRADGSSGWLLIPLRARARALMYYFGMHVSAAAFHRRRLGIFLECSEGADVHSWQGSPHLSDFHEMPSRLVRSLGASFLAFSLRW